MIAIGAGETPPGAIDFEELLATADAEAFVVPRHRRALGGGDVLHERHHGAAEGRRLLAPRDRDPLARLDAVELARHRRGGRRAAGRADVPRQRVGLSRSRARSSASEQVFPGPHLDPASLLDAFVEQKVTVTAGVPTIWMGILQLLDAEPERWDLSRLRSMIVGGAAAPQAMIEGFEKRHGLHIIHAWGMTEMAPMGTISALSSRELALPEDEQYRLSRQAGSPLAVRRDPRPRRRRPRSLGRRHDGRARGARPVDRVVVLRRAGGERPLDRRRLVQDRRHRHDRAERLRRDPGPLEGPRQVRRRVDLDRRARERADGPPGRARGRGDRRPGREVVGAPARGRRVPRGPERPTPTSCASSWRRTSRSGGCRSGSRPSTRSRRRRSASSARLR